MSFLMVNIGLIFFFQGGRSSHGDVSPPAWSVKENFTYFFGGRTRREGGFWIFFSLGESQVPLLSNREG